MDRGFSIIRLPYLYKGFLLWLAITLSLPGSINPLLSADGIEEPAVAMEEIVFDSQAEPYYYQALDEWRASGLQDADSDFVVNADRYTQLSDDAEARIGSFQGEDRALIWSNQRGYVEYEVVAPKAGLYAMELTYYPLTGDNQASLGPVTFSVEMNRETPFREARSLEFEREFKDLWPLTQDDNGDDMRPRTEEIGSWRTKAVRDSEGAYPQPLYWHLQEGINTIKLTHLREPVALLALRFTAPEPLPTYKDVAIGYPGTADNEGDIVIIEAEQLTTKNATSIQVRNDRDAGTTPASSKDRKYNTVGGWRWFKGGESVTWTFTAPKTGRYKIGMRVKQNFRRNLSVFRTLYIDGAIPFEEASVYPFPYHGGWTGEVLGDENQDYEFYLEEGRHTLTLTASNAPFRKVFSQLDIVSSELRGIEVDLKAATGGQGDEYRVWSVEEDMPDLLGRLERTRNLLKQMAAQVIAINGARENVSQTLESAVSDLNALIKKPNKIPNRQAQFVSMRESIESLRSFLIDSPLQVDKLYLIPASESAPDMTAGWTERLSASFRSFYHSFDSDNNLKQEDEETLNVWMMWGRDYVNELQQLADESFTPEYGMKVKINLVQQPELLILSNSAGSMPDVALGVPGDMPYDLALRGAARNLSDMQGADALFSSYSPGFLLPFYHEGGYYAIPETVQFKVLFYRKDIMKQLGLQIPDTWDDVYALLPTLLQNDYNFYIEPKDFSTIFNQNGVQLYERDGLKSGLDRPEAYAAFEKWTDLYNVYGLEKSVQSFYNQFRKGYMPLGIADFNQFLQLTVAAPELRDLWGIAPVPGTAREDGTVARWSGGISDAVPGHVQSKSAGSSMSAAMMFSHSDPDKEEMAWKFLQWYTSSKVQTEFGLHLEQFYGEQFRWNSANAQAFANMPWKPEELQVLLEQWRWYKDLPVVPGGYMTARELNFAWIRTVIDGVNPRTSMEQAIQEINRELLRKQQEFDMVDRRGNVLKTLNLPEVNDPWTGVDRYIEELVR
ncbi:extracellular solute-binding protein [Cohnella yongneupensis]|uniref:Extracellular solute-binding protein n=1 Tax=Cohnella yongneupensis TaxID=425006 RepID=A0ABW0R171_9BACL